MPIAIDMMSIHELFFMLWLLLYHEDRKRGDKNVSRSHLFLSTSYLLLTLISFVLLPIDLKFHNCSQSGAPQAVL